MAAFLIRRTIGAILVMLAVTFIVFLIFIIVPGGGKLGTAQRIAGKNATPQNVINIEHRWGFDKPFYVQYWRMLNRMFTNKLVSYTSQQPVLSQIVQGMPATFSLTIGASIIWLFFAVLFIGFYGRVLRGNILDTINEDYVRTAKAKGLAPRRVLVKHVLRNSLIPVITLFGLDFAGVLGGGAILTETVFDLHGVGQYAAQSINNFDLPPIMGVTMYGAFFIVTFSILVDVFYAFLDPRIRPT